MPPPLKTKAASAECQTYVDDLKAVLAKHEHLTPMEMLAGASHLVGTLVALQDQTKVTPGMAMQLVSANIERGNAEALTDLMKTEGES